MCNALTFILNIRKAKCWKIENLNIKIISSRFTFSEHFLIFHIFHMNSMYSPDIFWILKYFLLFNKTDRTVRVISNDPPPESHRHYWNLYLIIAVEDIVVFLGLEVFNYSVSHETWQLVNNFDFVFFHILY